MSRLDLLNVLVRIFSTCRSLFLASLHQSAAMMYLVTVSRNQALFCIPYYVRSVVPGRG